MSRGALMLSTTPSPCLGHAELGLRHCLGLSKTGCPWGHCWWCVPWAPQTWMPGGVPRCCWASVGQIARGIGCGHILIHAGVAPVQGGSAGCRVFTCLSAACSRELGCTRGAGCSWGFCLFALGLGFGPPWPRLVAPACLLPHDAFGCCPPPPLPPPLLSREIKRLQHCRCSWPLYLG